MKNVKQKNKTTLFFLTAFVVVIIVTILNNIIGGKTIHLNVPDNAGVSVLETSGDRLISVFQDGRAGVWDWNDLSQQAGDFTIVSDRAVIIDPQTMAAVPKTGNKILTVYRIPDGEKQMDLNVGWDDQEVWLRISPDKNILALIRRNPAGAAEKSVYEFLTVDLEKDLLSPPALLSVHQDDEQLIDFAVDNSGVIYAAGSREGAGRIAALDLHQGKVQWDSVFPDTKEFCACVTAPDNTALYAGNRNGILYQLSSETGQISKEIQLLEPGETRPITNDTSVLNLAFSGDGLYFVATINPKVYVLRTDSDTLFHTSSPADNLISKIAFSPDNRFCASSDIRASKPIKIWPLPNSSQ